MSTATRDHHAHVTELLPWFVNGTLEADERRQVEEHLARCDACRGELQATRSSFELHATHLPPQALTACAEDPRAQRYALGDGAAIDRSLVEAHLAHCASCREELELVRASRAALREEDGAEGAAGADPLPFRRPAAATGTRPTSVRWGLALAASLLLACVTAGGWFLAGRELGSERAQMADLERELSAARQAAAAADAGAGAARRAEELEEQMRRLRTELDGMDEELSLARQRVAALEERPAPPPAAQSDPWVYRTSLPEVVRGDDDGETIAQAPPEAGLLVFQVYGGLEELQDALQYRVIAAGGEVVASGSLSPRIDEDPLSGPYVGVALRPESLPSGQLRLELVRAGEVRVTIPFRNP